MYTFPLLSTATPNGSLRPPSTVDISCALVREGIRQIRKATITNARQLWRIKIPLGYQLLEPETTPYGSVCYRWFRPPLIGLYGVAILEARCSDFGAMVKVPVQSSRGWRKLGSFPGKGSCQRFKTGLRPLTPRQFPYA